MTQVSFPGNLLRQGLRMSFIGQVGCGALVVNAKSIVRSAS